jgi:hypothetical protein
LVQYRIIVSELSVVRSSFGSSTLQSDFSFPGSFEILGSLAKLRKTLADCATKLRQLAGAEKHKGNNKNEKEFRTAQRIKY